MGKDNIRVVTCESSPYRNKIYVLTDNKRREIRKRDLRFFGLQKYEVEFVTPDLLKDYALGGKLIAYPRNYNSNMNQESYRALFYSSLAGAGIEFGAACSPSPIPLGCCVKYADKFLDTEGCKTLMKNKEMVTVDFYTDLSEMKGIKNNSLNFIIHNHVMEHSNNPILSMHNSYNKLKKGGRLMFIIPNKHRTFDKFRHLTSLRHIAKDYYRPNVFRDVFHVIDFNLLTGNFNLKRVKNDLKKLRNGELDLHWHVYDEKSFLKLMKWYTKKVDKWTSYEVINGNFEFGVELIK